MNDNSTLLAVALEWLLLFQGYSQALADNQPTELRLENLRRLRLAVSSPELQAAIADIHEQLAQQVQP